MAKVTFLHISDFHFTKESNYDLDTVFDDFLADVDKFRQSHEIDSILITGDIAFSGSNSDYQCANEKLKKLAEITENLFLVPGNHDINYQDVTLPEGSLANDLLDGSIKADELFGKYGDYQLLFNKFKAYQKFVQGLYVRRNKHKRGLSSWEGSGEKLKPWYSRSIDIKRKQFRIIGLTTPLLANKVERKPVNVGILRQLQEALIHRGKDDYFIVLGHHPIEWVNERELNLIRGIMGRYKMIYLHGHTHEHQSLYLSFSPNVEYQSVAAGCLYSGSNYPNSYHFFEIDSEKNELQLWPRHWSRARGFIADAELRPLNSEESWTNKLPLSTKPERLFSNPYCLADIPLTFKKFPIILESTMDEKEGISFDVVVGTGRHTDADHVSFGTDCIGIPEVVNQLKNLNTDIQFTSKLDIDIYNTDDIKEKNLLLIGSGKVNYVTMKLIERFGDRLKFKFNRFMNLIQSNCGEGRIYEVERFDRHDWGLGILCLMNNPWAADVGKKRIIILIAGIHPIGTIASTQLLLRYIQNERSRKDNKFDPKVPLKIVRGKPIEYKEYLQRTADILEHAHGTPTYIGNVKEIQVVE